MSSESELSRLIKLFAAAEAEIEKEMLRTQVRGADYTAQQRQAKRNEIASILEQLVTLAVGGNADEPTGPLWGMVRDGYREGASAAADDLSSRVPGRGVPVGRGFGEIHQSAAEVVYENLRDRMVDAVGYVGRRVDDVFRQATLREIMAAQITGRDSGQVAKGIEEDLTGRGIRAFSDSRGREWKLSTYAEMAARTTRTEATSMGRLNRYAESGIDLVKMIVAADACDEYCKPQRNRVYSISGTSDEYPPLVEVPPFHPNCNCGIGAFVPALQESVA